mgnify:CR=1 FL=1
MELSMTKACELGDDRDRAKWLIDSLWLDEAVGVIGGEPKTCKTFMALEMAIAVSSGRPFLRHFTVENPGRVLLFTAEDPLHVVRRRLAVIAAASGADFSACDIQVITVPVLRLDLPEHRSALTDAVERLKPRLLILDPFIRLHRVDENHSGEIAPLLAYLRAVQKTFGTSIVVVHHARKRTGSARAGQSLRGSSEFHAWYDSHLYLTRQGKDGLRLDVEHRSAESCEGIRLSIVPTDDSLRLDVKAVASIEEELPVNLEDRIIGFLRSVEAPQSLNTIRNACRARKTSVVEQLAGLVSRGNLRKLADGFVLAS